MIAAHDIEKIYSEVEKIGVPVQITLSMIDWQSLYDQWIKNAVCKNTSRESEREVTPPVPSNLPPTYEEQQ